MEDRNIDGTIIYDEEFGILTFKREIVEQLSEKAWKDITIDNIIPDIATEAKCKCRNMVTFLELVSNE